MHAYTKLHCIANLVFRFVEAVNSFKDDVVKMPDRAQMERNSAYIYGKYKRWNVVHGIDGCHIPFDSKPR